MRNSILRLLARGLVLLLILLTTLLRAEAQLPVFDWNGTSHGAPLFAAPSPGGFLFNFSLSTTDPDTSKVVRVRADGQVDWARDYPWGAENLSEGPGGIFIVSRYDSADISIARLDPATGVLLREAKLNNQGLWTSIFSYGDYPRLLPTADSGLWVVPSERMCPGLSLSANCAIKLDKDLQVQHATGFGSGIGSQFIPTVNAGLARANGDVVVGSYVRNIMAPNSRSGLLVQRSGSNGSLVTKRVLHLNNNWLETTVTDLVELPDRVIVLVNATLPIAQGGTRVSYLAALSPALDQVLWAKSQSGCAVLKITRGPDGRIYGAAEGNVNAFCLNPDGSVRWARSMGRNGTFTMPVGTDRVGFLTVTSSPTFIQEFHLADTNLPGACMGSPVTLSQTNLSLTNAFLNAGSTVSGLAFLPDSTHREGPYAGFSQAQTCASACVVDAWFSHAGSFLALNFVPSDPSGTHFWDFGDGNTSSSANPAHTYASPGLRTVCHIVSTPCGSDTACIPVEVCPAPVADFGFGGNNLDVSFGNTSTGAGTLGYAWDFGDGGSSAQVSPLHTYASPGTYQVCLIATGACNADTTCRTVVVTCIPTTAAFNPVPNLYTVTFANASSGYGSLSHSWSFGDGNTSTQVNPVHTYQATGTYTVCLIVGGPCGGDTSCQSINVTCPATTAGYSSSVSFLTANFTSSSTGGGVLAHNWFFGDGLVSSLASPSHQYALPGTYTACLVVSGVCGTDTVCQPVTVVCPPDPVAGFGVQTTLLDAQFTDQSNGGGGPLVYAWDFGDGGSSSQASPLHTYAGPGTYTACLVTQGLCGADTSCQLVIVNCPTPTADFQFITNLRSAAFTNLSSSSSPAQFQWDFGDGGSSTLLNPTYTYAAEGSYLVCLTVSDPCGSVSHCDSVAITCPAIVAGFNHVNTGLAVDFSDQSLGSTMSGWAWDFGDGSTGSGPTPQHTYAQGGTYFVCLTVTDSCTQEVHCENITVSPIGVGEATQDEPGLVVWPIPADVRLHVRGKGRGPVVLVDALGRVLRESHVGPGAWQLEWALDGLADGVYAVSAGGVRQRVVLRR